MSVVAIVAFVVSVLLTISRFVTAAKPIWSYLPKTVAVILPAAVALVPQVVDLLNASKSAVDLTTNLIAAVALVVVNLIPKDKPAVPSNTQV